MSPCVSHPFVRCDPRIAKVFFFFNDAPPAEISTLPLQDALPILGATATTPTGTGSFFADAATTAFASCSLSGTGSSASCSVTYTPTTAGAHAITASYGGGAPAEGPTPGIPPPANAAYRPLPTTNN